MSNVSSSVASALPETASACFWKEIQVIGWTTFRNASLTFICNILSYGEKSKDLRAPDPGLHQQEKLWSDQPQTWSFSSKNTALVSCSRVVFSKSHKRKFLPPNIIPYN